ncbi:MAG: acetyl-CoA carboxylase biotin carboxyl carrier protein subunit [Bacteroidales bacterium]|nr:acetyl-CoA carboxylase biotin carboxyl carrier protein subunit [Bacteroidales bacterium]
MEIHIGNRTAEVELVKKEGNKVSVLIDGQRWDVDIVMAENGSCSILNEGHSFNAELNRSDSGKEYEVTILSRSFDVDIIDNQKKYLRMKQSEEVVNQSAITAPMAGKVVSIPVNVGQELAQGDTAIVLEAMKMQSNLKVTAPCRIGEILVKEGDTIETNETLIKLETL